ncbi:MAG TPA: response regulator transcription factor [Acidobacteriota bacterium]|nr:response regulator transcription factor [Acidobacteriota bacterium]
MISIVLADDHHIVRQGLRALLEAESDFRVIGEASNGRDAIELVRKLHPSVLVLDLMMPVLNGIEVTRQLGKAHPQTKIVILSMYANEAYVLETLANGASAYVLKDSNTSDLVLAVREVAIGRRYLSPPLSDRAIEAYQEKARSASLDKYETLTTREREILQLAAEGSSSTDIAAKLGISARTAETHRTNLMRKLNLHSQADLIRYALRRGIIPMED